MKRSRVRRLLRWLAYLLQPYLEPTTSLNNVTVVGAATGVRINQQDREIVIPRGSQLRGC